MNSIGDQSYPRGHANTKHLALPVHGPGPWAENSTHPTKLQIGPTNFGEEAKNLVLVFVLRSSIRSHDVVVFSILILTAMTDVIRSH
jgi:hypothetical protein